MGEKFSFLFSEYTIDGVRMSLTPARMLSEVSEDGVLPPSPASKPAPAIDESLDIAPTAYSFETDRFRDYLEDIRRPRHSFPIPYAGSHTCLKAAEALIDAIWKTGHFQLGDLSLRASWRWNPSPIGNVAALYDSFESVTAYLDGIGVKIGSLSVSEGTSCSVSFRVTPSGGPEHESGSAVPWEMPYRTTDPVIGRKRRCPDKMTAEGTDWLIYIPFDTCEYKLGGSTLAENLGVKPALCPDISDADYLIDCYEVVRELVEDGIVKAGVTVAEGGMAAALESMLTDNLRCEISLSGIMKAYGEDSPVRVLFSEVPGVIIEIADSDFDYLDAELMLQDVAYFPIARPMPRAGKEPLSLRDGKGEISGILESLLATRTSEGED